MSCANTSLNYFAFDTLLHRLDPNHPSNWQDRYQLSGTFPLFVTWYTNGHDLRGCIGTFQPGPLTDTLSRFSLVSALHDSRFPPISLAEVPSLTNSINLLHSFEPADSVLDWEVGTHGISLTLANGSSATFLPSVATELGGDKAKVLKHLVRKALGRYVDKAELKGLLESASLERYQSATTEASYDAYLAFVTSSK